MRRAYAPRVPLYILIPFGVASWPDLLGPNPLADAQPTDAGHVLAIAHPFVADLSWPEGPMGHSAVRILPPSYVPPRPPGTRVVQSPAGAVEVSCLRRMRPIDLPAWLTLRRCKPVPVAPSSSPKAVTAMTKRWAPRVRELLGLPAEMPEGPARRSDGSFRIPAGGAHAIETLFVQEGARRFGLDADELIALYTKLAAPVWANVFPEVLESPPREAWVDADGVERARARDGWGFAIDEDINGVPLRKVTLPAVTHPTPPLPLSEARLRQLYDDAASGRVAWIDSYAEVTS